MPTRVSWRSVLLGAGCIALTGCSQQDSDTLARIGRKLVDRSQATAGTIRMRVDADLQGLPQGALTGNDLGLKEKVEVRLRTDTLLMGLRLDVKVTGDEVEIKGTVKNETQRHRATDLAETTAGVQAVNDLMKVEE
jgi:osmotically-inducible protein OsmY